MKVLWKAIDDPFYPVRVTKRDHIVDYCEWFLTNVRTKEKSTKMSSYAMDNKIFRNNISMSARTIAATMRSNPSLFKFEDEYWSLNNDHS